MPVPGTLKAKAKAQHVSIREFCERAVALHGNIFRAAMALQVSPNAIRHHLNKPDDKGSEHAAANG